MTRTFGGLHLFRDDHLRHHHGLRRTILSSPLNPPWLILPRHGQHLGGIMYRPFPYPNDGIDDVGRDVLRESSCLASHLKFDFVRFVEIVLPPRILEPML